MILLSLGQSYFFLIISVFALPLRSQKFRLYKPGRFNDLYSTDLK